jgi:hypothetical protein
MPIKWPDVSQPAGNAFEKSVVMKLDLKSQTPTLYEHLLIDNRRRVGPKGKNENSAAWGKWSSKAAGRKT